MGNIKKSRCWFFVTSILIILAGIFLSIFIQGMYKPNLPLYMESHLTYSYSPQESKDIFSETSFLECKGQKNENQVYEDTLLCETNICYKEKPSFEDKIFDCKLRVMQYPYEEKTFSCYAKLLQKLNETCFKTHTGFKIVNMGKYLISISLYEDINDLSIPRPTFTGSMNVITEEENSRRKYEKWALIISAISTIIFLLPGSIYNFKKLYENK